MISLRDYQETMLDKARDHMRAGIRRILMVAPTGSGKRLMAVHTIGKAVERGKRCWFLVHRQELMDQAAETLAEARLPFGIVKSGMVPDYRAPVQLASIQTIVNRLGLARQPPPNSLRSHIQASIPTPDFIFADEAHHARAASWEAVLTAHPLAFILGFTATPQRLDGRSLGKHFDRLVIGPSPRALIDAGWLADYRLFRPPGADTAAVRTMAGDYRKDDLADAVDRPQIVGDAVANYRRYAAGTQAICFAVNVLHSQHLADAFNAAGISARHVDGDTERRVRSLALEDFTAGRFRVLCNVDILGEGLDVAGIETVICARPTRSLSVYLQQIGRGLRVKPNGRRAIIVDHAQNSVEHGFPDEERDWFLDDDPERRKKPREAGIKLCPACFAACKPQVRACPECGFAFVAETAVPEHAPGELVEVDPTVIRLKRRAEQFRAKTLDELIVVGRARGYRNPRAWAQHVIGWRQKQRSA